MSPKCDLGNYYSDKPGHEAVLQVLLRRDLCGVFFWCSCGKIGMRRESLGKISFKGGDHCRYTEKDAEIVSLLCNTRWVGQ